MTCRPCTDHWPHCAKRKCLSPQRTQDKDSASGACPVEGWIDSDNCEVKANDSKRPPPEQSFPEESQRGNARQGRMEDPSRDSLEPEEIACTDHWPHCAKRKCLSPQRTQDKDSASGACPVEGSIDSDNCEVKANDSKRPQPEQSFPEESRRGNARQKRMEDPSRDSLKPEEIARSTAPEGVRRSSLEPEPEDNLSISDRMLLWEKCKILLAENAQLDIENTRLEHTISEQREIISDLQRQETELPRYCTWEAVSKVFPDIMSYVLLGCGQECHLYPSDDDLIRNILGKFNISMDMQCEVKTFLSEWGKPGRNSVRSLAAESIRDKRVVILRTLRSEFYAQLGLPRPKKTEPEEVMHKWKQDLKALKQGNAWRESKVPMDPWGTDAVHHSLARVMYGLKYDRNKVVTLNLKQAGCLFYNLELAIDGLLMEPRHRLYHQTKMADMEDRVKSEFHRDMKRIVIRI